MPPQTTTIKPYSTGTVTITPNSAIPVDGYASLTLHSNVPVVSGLATGTGDWVALTSPQTPSSAYLVRNFSGLGFDAATVTNTSSRSAELSITFFDPSKKGVFTVTGVKIAGGATVKLATLIASFMKEPSDTYVISTAKPVLVLSLTIPSRPRGLYVVSTLDGR